MNRRNFLKNGTAAGVAVSAAALAGCNGMTEKKDDGAEKTRVSTDFELNEATVDDLQRYMKEGRYSAHSLTQLYLNRINEIDKKGPSINAVIEINPDALAIAAQLDKERKDGRIRGPLHGIPVLIKDNIDTGDKMMTTAGALALNGNVASNDAFIIRRLREAGAVLLGKTNLSEWANFRSSRSTSGWSSRGGQTRNPIMLDRNPCGSSSGSAAAVAANLCAIAIGTETDGSVIAPSSFCGIVGIKPTVGLLSRSGIIPISSTQDTAGPMARTVKDAAILLGALAGVDVADSVTSNSEGKSQKDYTAFLNKAALKGKRIGIEKSFLQGHEGVVALYTAAIEVLKAQGATVVEVELLKSIKEPATAEFTVLQYEFKDGVNRYLANSNANVKSLDDVIAYNKANEAKAMPYFKQETLESSNKKGDLNSKEYRDALRKSTGAREVINRLMAKYSLSAIAGTSIGLPCCIDLINGDYDTGFYFCPPAAMAGYPHITVPMGTVDGLPVGFSFMARAYEEPEIIAVAYAFEQATLKRKSPMFVASSVRDIPFKP